MDEQIITGHILAVGLGGRRELRVDGIGRDAVLCTVGVDGSDDVVDTSGVGGEGTRGG